MDSHLDNALDELKKIPQSTDEKTSKIVDKVQEELTKGRDEIADRQKKIKMADRSDYSWGMVEAYEQDELADNSADEKRMEKAEKEAERTAAKKKRTKLRGSSSGREEPEQKRLSRWEPSERTGGPARFPPQPPPARQKPIGPCWSCGKLDHLAAACPGHTSKWYPFLIPEDLSDDSCYLPEASQRGKGDVECVYEIILQVKIESM